jgi:hypothetical protein
VGGDDRRAGEISSAATDRIEAALADELGWTELLDAADDGSAR